MSSNEEAGEQVAAAKKKEPTPSHEHVELEDEGEEEDEFEEAEPVLAYSRMKNDFNDILTKDSVSCIKAGSKVIRAFFF